jgi:S-adenosylmethionine:tRNA ribosyltransferase-isomerase
MLCRARSAPSLLRAGDCLVFNDTRVIPAQLEGTRGDARIGATLHKRLDSAALAGVRAQCQAFAARRQDRLRCRGLRHCRGAGRGGRLLTLAFEGEEPVEVLLERAGRMPLPPYIAGKRRGG